MEKVKYSPLNHQTVTINPIDKRSTCRVKDKRAVIINVLAIVLSVLAVISTVEKFAVEKLDGNNGENEMEEHVNYEDIEDVLQ